jgi:hypothetical protein
MSKIPTDLKIFETLYKAYESEFESRSQSETSGQSKIYVPVDIDEVAKKLGTDAHILFGRLYYHLDERYRYQQDNGSMVHLFAIVVGDEKHCINFPYLVGLLADYRLQDRRNLWALGISILSIVIAAAALLAQLVGSNADAA